MTYTLLLDVLKGGITSGNWGHAGRPGKRGGSAPQSGLGAAMSLRTGPSARERQEAKRLSQHADYQIPINESTKTKVLKDMDERYSPEELERATEALKAIVDGAPVSMRVPTDVLPQILSSGRFKNQHETGTSMGALNPDHRRDVEQNAFGWDLEKPSDFPIYGYISTDKNGYTSAAGGYGDVRIKFKDSVKARTTITAGDSLSYFTTRQAVGTPLLHPGPEGLDHAVDDAIAAGNILKHGGTVPFGFGYVEAQIHGGLTVKDIEHVYVSNSAYGRDKAIAALEKAGIPYTIYSKLDDKPDLM